MALNIPQRVINGDFIMPFGQAKVQRGMPLFRVIKPASFRCISLHFVAFRCVSLHFVALGVGVVQRCNESTDEVADPDSCNLRFAPDAVRLDGVGKENGTQLFSRGRKGGSISGQKAIQKRQRDKPQDGKNQRLL